MTGWCIELAARARSAVLDRVTPVCHTDGMMMNVILIAVTLAVAFWGFASDCKRAKRGWHN